MTAGRKKHLRQLRGKIERLLARHHDTKPPREDRGLNQLIDEIYRTESRIRDEVETALKTGDWFRTPPTTGWTKVRKWFHLKQLKAKLFQKTSPSASSRPTGPRLMPSSIRCKKPSPPTSSTS